MMEFLFGLAVELKDEALASPLRGRAKRDP
jgi:hypothetical protein